MGCRESGCRTEWNTGAAMRLFAVGLWEGVGHQVERGGRDDTICSGVVGGRYPALAMGVQPMRPCDSVEDKVSAGISEETVVYETTGGDARTVGPAVAMRL